MSGLNKWFTAGKHPLFDAGLRLFTQEHFGDAAVNFEQFLAEDSADPGLRRLAEVYCAEAMARLGDQAMSENAFQDAVHHYQRAVHLQPGFADLQLKLAEAFKNAGSIDLGKGACENALKINPTYRRAQVFRAILEYCNEEHEIAMETLMEAIEVHPAIENRTFQEFVLAHNGGDTDNAQRCLYEIWNADDSELKGLMLQATQAFAAGKHEDAANAFDRLTLRVPNWADVRCKLGESLMELGHQDQSMLQLKEALRINPKYADAWAVLGVLYRRQGHKEPAREAFEKAIAVQPDHVVANAELDRLRNR